MEEKPQTSAWEGTTTRRFLRWVFSVRTIRRCLIALAWLVSLTALCYGVIDWRARRAWNEYRQNFEARVAPLDLQTCIPKPIPDSENFAATPFVRTWMKTGAETDTNFIFDHDTYARASVMIAGPKAAPRERIFDDLVAWEEAFAAVESHTKQPNGGFRSGKLDLASRAPAALSVLDGLRDDQAALDELRAASARSGSRYPIVYDMENPWGILIPHLAKIRQSCMRLELKACAELAASRSENALDDIKLVLYLADSAKAEPFLLSYLVRLTCIQMAVHSIWEGLAEHQWTDAQLRQLQACLESRNFLCDMQWPLHAECATGVLTVDLMRKRGLGFLASFANGMNGSHMHAFWDDETVLNVLGRILPAAWYDKEKLQYCVFYERLFREVFDQTASRVFPRQIAANVAESPSVTGDQRNFIISTPEQGSLHAIVRHEYIAAMLLPGLYDIPCRAAQAQTFTDQAAIACALERFRLANGQFPEDLHALVPQFAAHLPNDVITGEPCKYRRTSDGRFVLYSVGWNEKDDGGVPGKTVFDETEGDWVWEYPAP